MKKLNKKGFTLIELLAVIVILAIIVVVTVPTILNSINDARLSSLHSLAKEVANWYDTSIAQDRLALTGTKVLGTLKNTVEDKPIEDGTWHCLIDIKAQDGINVNKSLAEIYGLSSTDIYHESGGNIPNICDKDKHCFVNEGEKTYGPYEDGVCSAIRIINGRAEVFLVSNPNGKFDTNGDVEAYALSTGNSGYDILAE